MSGQTVISNSFRRLWILGFAGHRSLPDPAAVEASIRAAIENFRKQVDGEVMGRASAASGADVLFLEACRDAGLAYSVVLPFAEERFREDFDSETEWARSKALIDGAASVEIAPGHEGAPEAYHLAAREILDVADAMLFVWDGKPARGIGGTEETIADSRERRVPHQIIRAEDGELSAFETTKPFPWKEMEFTRLPSGDDMLVVFKTLDQRAMQGAPKSRLLAAGSITLNQIATLISGILIAFVGHAEAAPAVKFVIICVAAVLPWVGARRRIREVWVENRLHAELLRSLIASHAFTSPLRPFAAELFQSDEAFLRSASWKLSSRRKAWDVERDRYLDERLNGQITYLRSKGNLAAKHYKRLQTVFRISSAGAMILGACAIFNAIFDWPVPQWFEVFFLVFLPTILPAVAAWSLSMIALFETKRRAGLYLQMADRLETKRAELKGAKCLVTAAAAVSSCERLLLTELWEWSDSNGKRR
jgi:hypothetical protein